MISNKPKMTESTARDRQCLSDLMISRLRLHSNPRCQLVPPRTHMPKCSPVIPNKSVRKRNLLNWLPKNGYNQMQSINLTLNINTIHPSWFIKYNKTQQSSHTQHNSFICSYSNMFRLVIEPSASLHVNIKQKILFNC